MSEPSTPALPVEGTFHPPRVLQPEALSIAPGILRLRFGVPEAVTPVAARPRDPDLEGLRRLGDAAPRFGADAVSARLSARSCTVFLPHEPGEEIYGFGLQLKSHSQSGKKRSLRVNSDPVLDQGDSHAPVPFYVSTLGYAVYVDTARYASFYTGTHAPVRELETRVRRKAGEPCADAEALYQGNAFGDRVVADIPHARGVDVYLFAGPSPLEALRRYVLFSGGGCLAPRWALGNWYRAHAGQGAEEVLGLLDSLRGEDMPFDVLGLEPGWQARFYPNSFTWSGRFPDPPGFIAAVRDRGLRLNLWENAFVHPEAPFADEIRPHCGDELSTDGLAPDFLDPEARRIFAGHHRALAASGVSGFKLDECDNGDFQSFAWSFPEYTAFPSGADGEQMHTLYGVQYQRVIDDVFASFDQPHFGLVRSSGALAAPLPFALYSDLYDHGDFLRGLVNAGTSGLLWSAEVRHAESVEDLVRRVQTGVLSAVSMINAWYIPMPPWRQIRTRENEAGVWMADHERATRLVRGALRLRRRLVPVLIDAFARYRFDGIPPFRPLFFECPDDPVARHVDDAFLLGPCLLAAPLRAGQAGRSVFLPPGGWRDFHDGTRFEGGREHRLEDVPLDRIPLFVRDGAVLPLADADGAADEPLRVRATVFADGPAEGVWWEAEPGGRRVRHRVRIDAENRVTWCPDRDDTRQRVESVADRRV